MNNQVFTPFGNIAKLHRGYDLPNTARVEGNIPVISSSGIVGYHNEAKVTGENVLTGRSGTIGEVFYYNGACWPLNTTLYVDDFKGNNPRYIAYLLEMLLAATQSAGQDKSVVPSLDRNVVHDIVVPFYEDLNDQNAIVGVLSSIEANIKNNGVLINNLEAIAQLIYDYWFTQFDFPDENGKPYRQSGGKMVYSEELNRDIPEGWGVVSVGDITICHDSERIPLSGKEREGMKGDIPYYGATGIMDYVDRPIFNGDYILLAEDGSVMTEMGTPIVQRIWGKTWVNNHAHVLEPVEGYSPLLLKLILQRIPVVSIKTGSIQMKINQENLNSYQVIRIPDYLLDKVNNVLEPLDKKIIQLSQQINVLTKLRDWLLPMLMNGQVKVS